jgi:hypothetical protein
MYDTLIGRLFQYLFGMRGCNVRKPVSSNSLNASNTAGRELAPGTCFIASNAINNSAITLSHSLSIFVKQSRRFGSATVARLVTLHGMLSNMRLKMSK